MSVPQMLLRTDHLILYIQRLFIYISYVHMLHITYNSLQHFYLQRNHTGSCMAREMVLLPDNINLLLSTREVMTLS